MNSKFKNAGLALLFITSFIINIITLRDGHNWGDDFAQYIMYAQNMISHRPITEGVMLGLSVFPPIGYSILLAVVILFKGINFGAMKLLTVFFWFGMVIGYFYFLRTRKEQEPWKVIVLLLFSSMFFTFKQTLSPDIPFAFYVVWAVYFFEQYYLSKKNHFFYLFLLSATLSVLTRNAGVFLFAAALLYCLFILKEPKKILWLAGSFLICHMVQRIFVGVEPQNPWMQYIHDPQSTLQAMMVNFSTVFKSAGLTVVPHLTHLEDGLYQAIDPLLKWTSGLFLIVIFFIFLHRAKKGRAAFLDIAFICYLIGLISWAGAIVHPPEIFARYMIPVYGFILYYFFRILRSISPSITRIIFAVILFLNVYNISLKFNFNDDAILKSESQEMFAWVREHTSRDQSIMFTPPRALALMAQKHVGPIWFENTDEQSLLANLSAIKRWQYRYVIVFKEDINEEKWLSDPRLKLRPAWENKKFIIYEVIKTEI